MAESMIIHDLINKDRSVNVNIAPFLCFILLNIWENLDMSGTQK